MAREIEIEVIQREIVKPSSSQLFHCFRNIPTSDQISVQNLDELLPLRREIQRQHRRRLQRRRSRVRSDKSQLSIVDDTVKSRYFDTLEELVPSLTFPKDELSTSPLLIVQANFFDCGGLATGLSISHKIADASTVSTFLSAWTSAALKSEIEPALIPHFISSTSVFPREVRFLDLVEIRKLAGNSNEKVKLKTLVFNGPKIEALRSRASTDSTVPDPTRVELVSALIWKCAIEALSVSKQYSGYSFFQAVNIRKRTNPPLPQNTVRNLLSLLQTKIPSSNIKADKPEVKDLIVLFRKGVDELNAAWKIGTPAGAPTGPFEAMRQNDGHHKLLASSWGRLPLYGADFGWGRPVWILIPNMVGVKSMCNMMDTKDGKGIEVALWLGEEDMKRFETNLELLAFASLNPAVTD